jgi:hypothetical protein
MTTRITAEKTILFPSLEKLRVLAPDALAQAEHDLVTRSRAV